jgi:hypothetical protein
LHRRQQPPAPISSATAQSEGILTASRTRLPVTMSSSKLEELRQQLAALTGRVDGGESCAR